MFVQMKQRKFLIVVGGATATGKTDIAIRLAQHFDTAVLSADSRQFYREMSIGTAKPTEAERRGVPHYFIDMLSVVEPYSVGDFERDALRVLDEVFQRRDVAVLVGGSGLYLKAVYEGLDTFPPILEATRARVREGEATGGLVWLQKQVAALDPDYFQTVDRKNPARLRRALEVCLESGRPFSSFRQRKSAPRPFTPILLLLQRPRSELYERIHRRVDAMLAAGLEAEVRVLYPYRHLPALRTVGYKEWFPFFEGILSREHVVERIRQHTRNYAKRQETWFRKHGAWTAFHPDQWADILQWVQAQMELRAL